MAALRGLGSVYWHAGSRDSADARNAESLSLARSMAASDTAQYLQALATVLMELGWEQRAERLDQAIAYTAESFACYQALLDRGVKVNSYLTVCCRRMARYMILARRFADAEQYARREGAYSSDSRKPRKNLAHALLYQGRYDEARAIYAELKDGIWSGAETYRDVFLEDLNEFEKAGVSNPDVARIRALLGGTQDPPK
jgi:tetratricopeptide (TPR) repeat protein